MILSKSDPGIRVYLGSSRTTKIGFVPLYIEIKYLFMNFLNILDLLVFVVALKIVMIVWCMLNYREEKEDMRKSKTPTPEVDEEGYCVRPKHESWEMDTGCSFYSTSDTESGLNPFILSISTDLMHMMAIYNKKRKRK